ncbi:hypothetical protein JZ751_029153 [Albula glossodonta]|uniref:Uncharacterized protein n=1 Tax=Albula glossodonta TaxID=121402 RepID=A0A8T2PAU0_9TELE|nr:hypothetical protein JZ751_029153 [Albula glossodonta]
MWLGPAHVVLQPGQEELHSGEDTVVTRGGAATAPGHQTSEEGCVVVFCDQRATVVSPAGRDRALQIPSTEHTLEINGTSNLRMIGEVGRAVPGGRVFPPVVSPPQPLSVEKRTAESSRWENSVWVLLTLSDTVLPVLSEGISFSTLAPAPRPGAIAEVLTPPVQFFQKARVGAPGTVQNHLHPHAPPVPPGELLVPHLVLTHVPHIQSGGPQGGLGLLPETHPIQGGVERLGVEGHISVQLWSEKKALWKDSA